MKITVNTRVSQAITTKYLGPTNTKGSRVKAFCEAGSVTIPWDHALNSDQNHATAIFRLLEQCGWYGDWIMGWTKTGAVAVFDKYPDNCDAAGEECKTTTANEAKADWDRVLV